MFNLDPLKKARNVFRENLRKHNNTIKKKRKNFELLCAKYSAKATTVNEIVAVLAFMTRGSKVAITVMEKYLELCATPQELMDCACKIRDYDCVPIELFVKAVQKLNDVLLLFIDSAQSKEELIQVQEEVRFIGGQVNESNSKFFEIYQLLHLKRKAQILWSIRFARLCTSISELEGHSYPCRREIYFNRLRLLYKMERGHAPDSPRAKKRRVWLF